MRSDFDATGTIGSLPCEVSLNKILARIDDPRTTKAITRILAQCREYLKALKDVKDIGKKRFFTSLLRENIENRALYQVSKLDTHPDRVVLGTHTLCCIAAYFRQFDTLRKKKG